MTFSQYNEIEVVKCRGQMLFAFMHTLKFKSSLIHTNLLMNTLLYLNLTHFIVKLKHEYETGLFTKFNLTNLNENDHLYNIFSSYKLYIIKVDRLKTFKFTMIIKKIKHSDKVDSQR